MLTNNDLQLSEAQLQQYNEWASKVAAAYGEADALESMSITLSFTFCFLGRTVEAVVDGSKQKLVLDDCMDEIQSSSSKLSEIKRILS